MYIIGKVDLFESCFNFKNQTFEHLSTLILKIRVNKKIAKCISVIFGLNVRFRFEELKLYRKNIIVMV